MKNETLKGFKDSLATDLPPGHLSVYEESLWWAAKGNWNKAHELIQDIPDRPAARIHAYLHRVEGDSSNARYWYSRAGETMTDVPLQEEWDELVIRHLS